MVEENKKMLKVENEVVKKAYGTGSSQAVPHPSTIQARRCLTSVIRRERVYSSWYAHIDTIHCSAVAIALLRFGRFVRSLWAIVSCSVMERGAGSG